MTKRLHYENKKNIYDRLVDRKFDHQIFSEYRDLFLLAACIGYKKRKREKMSSNHSNRGELHWNSFDNTDLAVINSIALSETSDINVILDTDEMIDKKIRIIEEYAHGGIQIIKKKVLDMPGDPLDNLINYIFEELKEEKEMGILEEIESEFYE